MNQSPNVYLETLRAVLCAPDGTPAIRGSEADRQAIADALRGLTQLAAHHPEGVTDAARDVLAARLRGGVATPVDDQIAADGQLARAAAAYAAYAAYAGGSEVPDLFPFGEAQWQPGKPREALVQAGAWILAEIERIDRTTPPLLEGSES